jgi:signal transduction histidine kinase
LRSERPDTLPLIAQPASARVVTYRLPGTTHDAVAGLVTCSELTALAPAEVAVVCDALRRLEPDLVVIGCSDDRDLIVVRQLKLLHETHFIPLVVVAPAELRRAGLTAGADHVTVMLDEDTAIRAKALVRSAAAARAVRASRQELRLRRDWVRYLVHDLRNLLTRGIGHLARARRADPDPELAAHLAHCEEELWRGAALLHDVLDVDRIRRGALQLHRTPTELGELARRAAATSGAAADAIVVEATTPVVATVDASLIERVVANLLGNALRFAAPGTPIRVAVEAGAGVAGIAVENRGPSITAERVETLFEPFVTDGPGGNSGLGLAFCRLVAEIHDGAIAVIEPDGGGARFTVTLPL